MKVQHEDTILYVFAAAAVITVLLANCNEAEAEPIPVPVIRCYDCEADHWRDTEQSSPPRSTYIFTDDDSTALITPQPDGSLFIQPMDQGLYGEGVGGYDY